MANGRESYTSYACTRTNHKPCIQRAATSLAIFSVVKQTQSHQNQQQNSLPPQLQTHHEHQPVHVACSITPQKVGPRRQRLSRSRSRSRPRPRSRPLSEIRRLLLQQTTTMMMTYNEASLSRRLHGRRTFTWAGAFVVGVLVF
jgi:hypothetical protein